MHELQTCPPLPGVEISDRDGAGDPTALVLTEGVPGRDDGAVVVLFSGGRWPVAVTVTISKCAF